MKVKIFKDNYPNGYKKLEFEMNDWFEANEDIEIDSIHQSLTQYELVITVVYYE
jgi:hypothetical protein